MATLGSWPSSGLPCQESIPADGCDKPLRIRRRVDFPQPEGPSKAMILPGSMTRLVEPTTWIRVPSGWGYHFSTATASMMASLTKSPRFFYTRSADRVLTLTSLFTAEGVPNSGGCPGAALGSKRPGQPVAELDDLGQLGGQFAVQITLVKAPSPIAAVQAGSIHAGIAAEAHHVLQGDDAKAGRGAVRGANEGPMDAVFRASDIRFRVAAFMIGCRRAPPTEDGVIVVSSGVDDLARGSMRKVDVRPFVAETELQHRHARNLEAIAQGVNFGCDVAQILGEEGQATQGFPQ